MKTIGTLIVLALFAISVACTSADTSATTVLGVDEPPPAHSHQLLEY